MKKWNIWLLIGVVGMAFFVLIGLQISYYRSILTIQTTEFNDAVQRSLAQVVYILEQDETRRYLENELEERDREVFSIHSMGWRIRPIIPPQSRMKGFPPDRLLNLPLGTFDYLEKIDDLDSQNPNSMSGSFESMQETLKDRYLHQKFVLEDVIFRILHESSSLPIEQRVDLEKLERYLSQEFQNNGIGDLPFHFNVLNPEGLEVYRCNDLYGNPTPDYKEILFPNDEGNKHSLLCVYFPTKGNFINDPLRLFVLVISFTIVLMFVFAFTVIVIFRQKKLSDMKNDFVNNMTHELKTPISTISLAAQMLKDPDVGKTPQLMQHATGVINDESKRLSLLVEKVLQMSLFEKDRSTLSFRETDVHRVIESVVSAFRLKVQSYHGELKKELTAEDYMVIADEMHITNVIFNLLDNAVKYRSEDRDLRLEIHTRNEKDGLIIEISDNGKGIKKEHLKRIFERFYRIPTGNVHNVKGFGLGLAYVRNIILNHKGTINVESEQDSGTKFIIYLPLIKKQL